MPDYRKKKHGITLSAPKPKKQKAAKQKENIEMTPAEKYRKTTVNTNMKVVKGKRFEKVRRLRLWASVILIAALIFGILQLALPMGVFEWASNAASLAGGGSYPIDLDGNRTLNAVNRGAYTYVLGNNYVSAYTNAGKTLFSYPHGFENPIIKTSASRALVFEQNGTKAMIFTLGGLKESIDTEKNIITANISDSGAYAFATRSEKYTCEVTVYAKNGKMLYEWYSAENIVNNVALSPNGKKMAISSFKSENGKYKSNLSVLSFKSATPEYSEDLDNTLIYNIDSTAKRVFTAATENSIEFIKWSDYKKSEYKNDYSLSIFRADKNNFVAVFNRKNDKTDNRIAVFSKTGQKQYEAAFKGTVTDLASHGGSIYCMSDTDLMVLGRDGAVLKKASCGFGAVRIIVTADSTVAVITDNRIEKIKLKSE